MPVTTQDGREAPEEWPTGRVAPAAPPSGAVATEPIPDTARSVLVADRPTRPAPWTWARRQRRGPALRWDAPWPLLAILAVQAALSLRLMWSNTAFQDEALYLWAGRMEWAHWLHGTPMPEFATWFSGSPAIYPPIGALAADVGGLAAARALSLVFMLATTVFLWGTAKGLFGRRTAFFATVLFAVLANTQFLGAFATHDAMAIMLIAFSTWLGVVSAARGRWPQQLVLLATAASTLALADAAKYAATLFDPVVLAVVVLAAGRLRGRRASVRAGLIMSGTLLTWLAAGVLLAGAAYWRGIASTTFSRPAASASAIVILERSYVWTSLVIVLAALGMVLARHEGRRVKALVATLSLAALLVPAEQIHVHTTVSLQKHVDYGAWFAVIAAGYAMARVSRLNKGIGWAPVLLLPIIAFTVSSSLGQAVGLFQVWPDAAPLISALRPVLGHDHRLVLAEGDEYPVILYYLGNELSSGELRSTYNFTYITPRSHRRIGMPASFADAIKHSYFGVIVLDHAGGSPAVDDTIAKAVEASPHCRQSLNDQYMQLHTRRSFTVWTCRPSPRRPRRHRHARF